MTKKFFERGKQIAKWADNNMTKDEALKMAIENLEFVYTGDDDIHTAYYLRKLKETIQACKEALEQPNLTYEDGFAHGYEAHRAEQALEQPAQEPTWIVNNTAGTKLRQYTHPTPSWQKLSDDERFIIVQNADWDNPYDIAELIEQALKEKNNAMQ